MLFSDLTLKALITTATDKKVCDIFFFNFRKNKVIFYENHHAQFVIFEKKNKIWNSHLLQIIGGALCVYGLI